MTDTINGLDTRDRFCAIFFTRDTTLVISILYSCKPSPLWKWSALKGKNLLPRGSKFFPFRVDPFSERKQTPFDSYLRWKIYLFLLNLTMNRMDNRITQRLGCLRRRVFAAGHVVWNLPDHNQDKTTKQKGRKIQNIYVQIYFNI